MIAVGIGAVWFAYFLGLWGVCMLKSYDVTVRDLLSPTWPPKPREA